MEALAIVGVIVALGVIGWIWLTITDAVEDKAVDLTDRAFFGQQRRQTDHLGTHALRIRTRMPSDQLWHELGFRLPLPSGKPRFEGSLYIAETMPTTEPTSFGVHVNWNECVQSGIVVYREDGITVCEHIMLQWATVGMVMRNAAPHFQALRETLVSIIQSLDPTARATLVNDDEREIPFAATPLPQH